MTIKPAAYFAPVFLATPVLADTPNVVTDFAPVQAVVARVMEGVGTPQSILKAGDDPHHFAMRPSHARTLADADVVIWTGAALTPWLDGPIDNLSDGAVTLELLSTEGWEPLALRGTHSHDHGEHEDHDDHDDHGHDDHADDDDHGHDDHDHGEAKADEHDHDEHDHEEHAEAGHEDHDHDDHKDEHADHDDHDHDEHKDEHADHDDHEDHGQEEAGLGVDPHAWLDPAIVAVWAGAIAETLAAQDPDQAEAYRANAVAFAVEMEGLSAEVAELIDSVDGDALIFSHDATQYFETAFAIAPMDYVAASDASDSGPAHLRELREAVTSGAITCVFSDMESNPGTINTLIEGTEAGTATLDLTNAAGTDYPTMIRTLAMTIATCE